MLYSVVYPVINYIINIILSESPMNYSISFWFTTLSKSIDYIDYLSTTLSQR